MRFQNLVHWVYCALGDHCWHSQQAQAQMKKTHGKFLREDNDEVILHIHDHYCCYCDATGIYSSDYGRVIAGWRIERLSEKRARELYAGHLHEA